MGSWSTKIHALVDALANPLDILLTVDQRAVITDAESLRVDYQTEAVVADRGYEADS